MPDWMNYGDYEMGLLRVAAPPNPVQLPVWRRVAKHLDPYFAKPRTSSVRAEFLYSTPNKTHVGRLAWSGPSFSKWCETSRSPKNRHFFSFDAVTPGWSECSRRKEAADAYFKMGRGNVRDEWSHWLLLAVRTDSDLPPAIETMRDMAGDFLPVSLHKITGPFAEAGIRRRGGGDGMSNPLDFWFGWPPDSSVWKKRKLRL